MITACSGKEQLTGTTVVKEKTSSVTGAAVQAETKVAPQYDPNVKVYLDKAEKVESYSYHFSSRVLNNFGNFEELKDYNAFVKGNQVKKVYLDQVKYKEGVNYDTVFLNLAEKTTFGVCLEKGAVMCSGMDGKAFKIDYGREKLVTPQELMELVPPSAKIVGEETIDRRNTVILGYINARGQQEKLSVDKYSGLPMKRVVYQMEGDQEVVLEKTTFTQLSVGNVKSAEVTLPSGLTQLFI